MTRHRKIVFIALAVLVCAVLGFAFGRLRTRRSVVYGGFEPYTINQKVEKVFDNGRVVAEELITVYTASDGSMREVRARLKENSDQFDGTPRIAINSMALQLNSLSDQEKGAFLSITPHGKWCNLRIVLPLLT
jgi:hypothetical protein